MTIASKTLQNIIEAALLASAKPLNIKQLQALFEDDDDAPKRRHIESALADLSEALSDRGIELKNVSSGYRLQVKAVYGHWIGRLWEERPQKYSRAMLETLALVAYRQPITRSEIEEIRGVAVSSNIIRTLSERDWIRVIGHKDVPGRPAMYATTRMFLDYFNLSSLEQLPSLADIRDLDTLAKELNFDPEVLTEAKAIEQREQDKQQRKNDEAAVTAAKAVTDTADEDRIAVANAPSTRATHTADSSPSSALDTQSDPVADVASDQGRQSRPVDEGQQEAVPVANSSPSAPADREDSEVAVQAINDISALELMAEVAELDVDDEIDGITDSAAPAREIEYSAFDTPQNVSSEDEEQEGSSHQSDELLKDTAQGLSLLAEVSADDDLGDDD